jgi:hypothetical protein
MNTYEKKKKAAMIAVAYYIEQEKAKSNTGGNVIQLNSWARTGIEIAMNKRTIVQRKGRILFSA